MTKFKFALAVYLILGFMPAGFVFAGAENNLVNAPEQFANNYANYINQTGTTLKLKKLELTKLNFLEQENQLLKRIPLHTLLKCLAGDKSAICLQENFVTVVVRSTELCRLRAYYWCKIEFEKLLVKSAKWGQGHLYLAIAEQGLNNKSAAIDAAKKALKLGLNKNDEEVANQIIGNSQ